MTENILNPRLNDFTIRKTALELAAGATDEVGRAEAYERFLRTGSFDEPAPPEPEATEKPDSYRADGRFVHGPGDAFLATAANAASAEAIVDELNHLLWEAER